MGFQSFLILLFISVAQARNDCSTSRCDKNGVSIQSPFWLTGQNQKPLNCECEPQGFNLSCNSKNIAILSLPYTGVFYVSSIYYDQRRVMLHDPDDCLPRRLLQLNLSSSPLMAISYQNYTFFGCPKAKAGTYAATIIGCLSNSTTDVIVTTSSALDMEFSRLCKKLATVRVPVSSGYHYDLLPDNLELTWNGSASTGNTNRNIHTMVVLSVVMSALLIPAMIASISCCICMIRRDNAQVTDTNQMANRAGPSRGLEKSTIETYRKIIVGESCRIEGPNDSTCTICLADYAPTETIRFMPECKHCFHVECIDEWLSINNKCPVCRNSQSGANAC